MRPMRCAAMYRSTRSTLRLCLRDRYAASNLSWPPPENTPAEFTMLSDYQSEPARHPYRIYVGLLVAIVLGLLVYVTWRNNSTFWSSGNAPAALPQAVPEAKSEAPSAAGPAATSAEGNNTTGKPANAPIHPAAPSQKSNMMALREMIEAWRITSAAPAKTRHCHAVAAAQQSRRRSAGTEWRRRIGRSRKVLECRAGYGSG